MSIRNLLLCEKRHPAGMLPERCAMLLTFALPRWWSPRCEC